MSYDYMFFLSFCIHLKRRLKIIFLFYHLKKKSVGSNENEKVLFYPIKMKPNKV